MINTKKFLLITIIFSIICSGVGFGGYVLVVKLNEIDNKINNNQSIINSLLEKINVKAK